jgi:hypothetical protein
MTPVAVVLLAQLNQDGQQQFDGQRLALPMLRLRASVRASLVAISSKCSASSGAVISRSIISPVCALSIIFLCIIALTIVKP